MPKINKHKTPESGIIYQGPSLIDGAPIVCIVVAKSDNRKTGNMVQTYILRSDIDPIAANRTGADYSICGNCKHRGKAQPTDTGKGLAIGRTCYVNIGQGVGSVYRAFRNGSYPMLSPEQATRMGSGRMIRLGTYGDASAVPSEALKPLLSAAKGHTAYTHQSGLLGSSVDLSAFMVSADSEAEALQWHAMGKRTFRVIPIADSNKPLLQNEIMCPNSTKGIECIDCRLCNGGKVGKSIAIVAHGPTAGKFK